LQQACAELHLQPPDLTAVHDLLKREASQHRLAIAKVMLVPVPQGRGYGRAWPSAVDVIVLFYPPTAIIEATYREGIVLDEGIGLIDPVVDHGVKSLSRQAQVLATPRCSCVIARALSPARAPPICSRNSAPCW
jgi:hypothetical protein